MSEAELCKSCGEVAVIWDTYDNQTTAKSQKVCTECGAIAEEGSYAQEANLEGEYISGSFQHQSRNLPSSYNKHLVSITHLLKDSRKALSTLGSKLKMTSPMISESKELFERVYRNPEFLHKNREKKMLLVAACIYIVVRQHGWPLSYQGLCSLSENEFTAPHNIAKEVHIICNSFRIEITSASLEDQVDGILHELSIDTDLKDLTLKITELCKEAWIAEGRNPRKVVLAAIFIAWQTVCVSPSTNINPRQKFKTYKHFLESRNIKVTSHMQTRLKEMLTLFCELAKEIPWVNSKQVTPKTVYTYVNDVLRYRNTLMTNAYTEEDESDTLYLDEKDTKEAVSLSTVNDENPNSYADANKNDQSKDNADDKCQPSKKRSYSMLGERLPMSFKQQKLEDTENKTKSVAQVPEINHDLDNPELTEDDIPESNLHEYVKSQEEIEKQSKQLENLMNAFL